MLTLRWPAPVALVVTVALPPDVLDVFGDAHGFCLDTSAGPDRDRARVELHAATAGLATAAVWREAERLAGRALGGRGARSVDEAARLVWLAFLRTARGAR